MKFSRIEHIIGIVPFITYEEVENMAEKGQVTQIKPNNKAVVKMLRTEACAKCRVCMTFSSKEMVMEASNQCGADVGDWVELEMQHDGFFNAVMIMYAFPCARIQQRGVESFMRTCRHIDLSYSNKEKQLQMGKQRQIYAYSRKNGGAAYGGRA